MANVRVRDSRRSFVIALLFSVLHAIAACATVNGSAISSASADKTATANVEYQTLAVDGCSIASGFYPLVPTWTLLRGSKKGITWRNPKRVKKTHSHKKMPSAKTSPKTETNATSDPNSQDDNPETKSAPHSVPADFVPLYAPDSVPALPVAQPIKLPNVEPTGLPSKQ